MNISKFDLFKEEKLEPPDRNIRCYKCFRADVVRMCHHCGRYMCKDCEPRIVRWLERWRVYRYLFKDVVFLGLYPLDKDFRVSYHCHDHIHYRETIINLLIWASGIFCVSMLAYSQFFGSPERIIVLGTVLFLLLVFLLFIPFRGVIYAIIFGNVSKTYYLFPRFKVEIKEALTANFSINKQQKQYLSVTSTNKSAGEITISLWPTPDDYRRYTASNNRKDGDTIRFEAGYLGLDNLSQVIMKQKPQISIGSEIKNAQLGIHRLGKLHLAGQIPGLIIQSASHQPIKIQQVYDILENAGWVGPSFDREFPFWIIPDLSLAGRELNLSIYVAKDLKGSLKLEYFSLTIPDQWRNLIFKTDGLSDDQFEKVIWLRPNLIPGANRFFIQFTRPLPHDLDLKGEYKISMPDHLLSQLKMDRKEHLWFANGDMVREAKDKTRMNQLESVNLTPYLSAHRGGFYSKKRVRRA